MVDSRPELDTRFIAPDGSVVTVRARWPGGVVFDNETSATLEELKSYTEISKHGE